MGQASGVLGFRKGWGFAKEIVKGEEGGRRSDSQWNKKRLESVEEL